MKSFLKSVVQRKEGSGLLGRTLRVGSYTVRVEAHLADGGFAAIYKVRDQATPACFALKHMRIAGDPEARADCTTEIDVMKRLRGHPNVLMLRAVEVSGTRDSEEALLLLDLCQDSLVDHMRAANWKLPMGEVATIFHSVTKAVALMHHQAPPMSHRDLKAENVLLHTSGAWVLCDFGSTMQRSGAYLTADSIMVAEEQIRKHTTPAYRAPEMYDLYSREPVGIAADCWALGVLLYFMCAGRLPFQGDCKLQVLNGAYAPLPVTTMPALKRLVQDLLVTKPANRLTVDEVLRRMEEMTCLVEVQQGNGHLAVPLPGSPGGSASPSYRSASPEPVPAGAAASLPPLVGSRSGSLVDTSSSTSSQPVAEASEGWAGGWAVNNWESTAKPPFAFPSVPTPAAISDGQQQQQPQQRAPARAGRRASETGLPSTSQKSLLAGLPARRPAAPPPQPPQLGLRGLTDPQRGIEGPRGDAGQREKDKLRHVHSHAAEFLQQTAVVQVSQAQVQPPPASAQLISLDTGDITPQRSSASNTSANSGTPIPPLMPPPPASTPAAPRVSGDNIPSHPLSLPRVTLEDRSDSGSSGHLVGRSVVEPNTPGGWSTLGAGAKAAGGMDMSGDIAALKLQLTDALAENSQLKASLRSQAAALKHLQAENQQLKRSQQRGAELEDVHSYDSSQDPWAAFPQTKPNHSNKPETRQKPPTSPTRGGSGIPLGSLRRRADFQPLVEVEPSSATTIPPTSRSNFDPFGVEEGRAPSGTPPDGGGDTFSLLAEPSKSSTEQRSRLALEKVVGGKHRRTTSEPTPIESWNLHAEWP